MLFFDVVYKSGGTIGGKITVGMANGLPQFTSTPETILSNMALVCAATTQGELPNNPAYGVPSKAKIELLQSNIAANAAGRSAMLSKIGRDSLGVIQENPGLGDYTKNINLTTVIKGATDE